MMVLPLEYIYCCNFNSVKSEKHKESLFPKLIFSTNDELKGIDACKLISDELVLKPCFKLSRLLIERLCKNRKKYF